jgi:uncharacterized protein
MKIYVKAKTKTKKEYVKKIDETHYIVAVMEPPVSGKANQAIIKSLSVYFHKPISQIFILHGEKYKQKIIEVPVSQKELLNLETQKKLF